MKVFLRAIQHLDSDVFNLMAGVIIIYLHSAGETFLVILPLMALTFHHAHYVSKLHVWILQRPLVIKLQKKMQRKTPTVENVDVYVASGE